MMKSSQVPVCLLVCIWLSTATADEQTAADPDTFFDSTVVSVLKQNCLKCHSGSEPKGGLDLTTRESVLAGGESGPAIDREAPEDSLLLQAVRYESFEMPPTGKMSPRDISVIERWVEMGAPWSKEHKRIEVEPERGPPPVNEQTKAFWAFQPVRPVSVPATSGWGHNQIDAFVLHRLQEKGLQPSPPANARELVRRMHYDITGLPPDPAEAESWAKRLQKPDGQLDQRVVRELVDHLLESPHYGEHWGRHWLDLVRYAETNSYERDGAKPHVWRYRDYVIQSFNDDKPYDRFIIEQLAGDELPEPTADSIIATGYYRLGRWDDEPPDPELAFYDDLDDIVTTTGQTFLGLTVNCARCHDHKIDPIPQRDYYRLIAFFHNIRRYGVRGHDSVLAASVREIDRPADPAAYEQVLKRYEAEVNDATSRLERIEKRIWDDLQDVEKQEFQYDMNRVPIVEKRRGTLLNDKQVDTYRQQFARLMKLRENKPTGLGSALCVKEDVRNIRPTHILMRGNPHARGEVVTPGFPSVLSPPDVELPEVPEGAESSGRRMILARWIASPENPLTARVMVNRIWQYHFGRGIVRTSSDFGFQGSPPTHPQLLDWLASRFVENGWSIKDMHRLIMTSATYQMSSRPRDDAYAVDPTNDCFWRFNMRRLTAEEVRDSILWANGSLNAAKMFGPSIYTDIPDEVKAGQSRPGSGWGNSSPEDKVRRSIYIHVKRSLRDPLLESFDGADTDQTCPVRFVTTQPTQALGLLNSEFALQQAQVFADYVRQAAGDDTAAAVRVALLRVTQREPTETEVARGVKLIEEFQKHDGLNTEQALKYFCLLALNLNEFLYID